MKAIKKILFLAAAFAALSAYSSDGRSPHRMGNQIVVTFDKPWNVSLEEGVRFDPKCPDPDVKLDVYYPNDKFKGGKKPYPCILLSTAAAGAWATKRSLR